MEKKDNHTETPLPGDKIKRARKRRKTEATRLADEWKESDALEEADAKAAAIKSKKDAKPIDGAELDSRFPTATEWRAKAKTMKQGSQLIEGLLPDAKGSYGAIAGRTGIGKTNIALHMGYCLATGQPFLGLKCKRVKVVVVAFEGDPKNLSERLDKISVQFPPTDNLHFDLMDIQGPEKMLEEVGRRLDGTPDVKVVILDPIKYLVRGNYLKPSDVVLFLTAFQTFLTESGLSAILTLPIRKPDSKGLIQPGDVYTIKGATEWVDSANFCLLAEKRAYAKSEDEITMSFAKHRVASQPLGSMALTFDRKMCMHKKSTMIAVDLDEIPQKPKKREKEREEESNED